MDMKENMNMISGGLRPRDGNDNRTYHPNRDLNYCVPPLMQLTTNSFYKGGEASKDLEELWDYLTPGRKDPGDEDKLMEMFAQMVEAIGKGFCQKFMRGERTFNEALQESTLDKFPQPMVDLWLKHFSHTILSTFYYGYRSVLMKGESDPADYDAIFDTAEDLRRYLREGKDAGATGTAEGNSNTDN